MYPKCPVCFELFNEKLDAVVLPCDCLISQKARCPSHCSLPGREEPQYRLRVGDGRSAFLSFEGEDIAGYEAGIERMRASCAAETSQRKKRCRRLKATMSRSARNVQQQQQTIADTWEDLERIQSATRKLEDQVTKLSLEVAAALDTKWSPLGNEADVAVLWTALLQNYDACASLHLCAISLEQVTDE
ncbi:hypothetical protein BV25DRAFT_1843726 [Artomyces pyxidatus]|uniref:Uncharacterized protein n=1 Tax=Artomyces pyxidatus TaxID=48021 RepID=A0ACB8SF07_9AGAM|nr:hypothetical protein BV25DRAFT_1843726 [Artomyces pyxidatus]